VDAFVLSLVAFQDRRKKSAFVKHNMIAAKIIANAPNKDNGTRHPRDLAMVGVESMATDKPRFSELKNAPVAKLTLAGGSRCSTVASPGTKMLVAPIPIRIRQASICQKV
jgi:hypothetical protein